MKSFICRSCTTTVRHGIRWDTWSDLGIIRARNIGSARNKAERRWPKQVHAVYEVTNA